MAAIEMVVGQVRLHLVLQGAWRESCEAASLPDGWTGSIRRLGSKM